MKTLMVMPVRPCRRCGEDRPHRVLTLRHVLACCVCGTWRRR